MALLDGYTKEAASSLSSALERFIEYYILVICLKHNIPFENFINSWKQMANQSERQLGAFFILSLIEKRSNRWNEKEWVPFRNKVIHKGYIPKTKEVLDYGEYVLSFIFSTLLELKENDIKFLQKALLFHIAKNGDKIPDTVLKANGSIPTIINLRSIQSPNFGSLTFRDALKSVKENFFYKKFYRKNLSEI